MSLWAYASRWRRCDVSERDELRLVSLGWCACVVHRRGLRAKLGGQEEGGGVQRHPADGRRNRPLSRKIVSVYDFLEEKGGLEILDDPVVRLATREVLANGRPRPQITRDIRRKVSDVGV